VELRTARLTLRPYAISDYAESADVWGDLEVVRYLGNVPATREQSWSRTLRYIGHWAAFGFGMWAVRDHAGAFVGDVGISDHKRDLDPPLTALEAGWVLAPRAQGQGYATEALGAAIDWFERTRGVQDIACMIDPPNAPSRRVAAKHGFVEQRRAIHHGDEVIVLIRPSRPDPASRARS
jgi:RimJ/RimL family protein N-acetyltransferase